MGATPADVERPLAGRLHAPLLLRPLHGRLPPELADVGRWLW
jgi:hypothetical protein